MKSGLLTGLILVFLAGSCDLIRSKNGGNGGPVAPGEDYAVSRSYFDNGTLRQEVPVDDSSRAHGLVKQYYQDGKLYATIEYVRGRRDGEAIWYYKSGQPYRVTIYRNNKREGIQKKYYEDGALMAEIPYRNDEVVPGLKEYNEDGSQIPPPSIVVREVDLRSSQRKLILQVSFSERSYNDRFYYYQKTIEGNDVLIPAHVENGTGEIPLNISPGANVSINIHIKGEKTTGLDNELIIEKDYNLKVSSVD